MAMLGDIRRASAALRRAARRLSATHVFIPDHLAPIRNAFALLPLRAKGVRVVMKLANAPDPGRFYRFYWRWLINPQVDQFVCNSDFTMRELLAHRVPLRKVSCIPYAIAVRPGSKVNIRRPHNGRIVYVGQVIPGKGLDLLIEAVAQLNLEGLPATLAVVGDIDGWTVPEYVPFRKRLRERAASPELAGRVEFLGWREDVVSVMSTADVQCAPSRPELREGFGLVNLEAKQAGVPSVVFASGAFPEVVTHKVDGWVCAEVSAAALAEGLKYFLTDRERLDAASAAARRSLERFDVPRFNESWWSVFAAAAALPERRAGLQKRTATGEVTP